MSLDSRTIYELRAIAQSMKLDFTLGMDKPRLIDLIQKSIWNDLPKIEVTKVITGNQDAEGDEKKAMIMRAVEHLTPVGLIVSFSENCWYVRCGKKADSGNLSMPLHTIIQCAENVART